MRKLVLTFVLIFASSMIFAQFTLGPKIGYNTSKLSVDQSEIETSLKNSFQFGIFARIGKFDSKLYVQPEINWLTQGGVFKQPSLSGGISPFEQEVNLKTVQIPVIIGYKIINPKIINIRILAGPVASIVTDKNIESEDISGYIKPIEDANIEDLIWSLQIGAGVDILMFTIDVRYNIGLNKVIKDITIDGKQVTFASKVSGFSVSLGWKIF
ncbi:MAG: PorT family protein [Bacteroidetes bacterium]|nr:PorT family protein [Bacteroidota bacterium]MCK4287684.1 PorT family protein [Bacteroidales bacterium]